MTSSHTLQTPDARAGIIAAMARQFGWAAPASPPGLEPQPQHARR